ncbi:hypothetical protein ABBQ32_005431 [Trebouxia sp. C0010 RCD-2024]
MRVNPPEQHGSSQPTHCMHLEYLRDLLTAAVGAYADKDISMREAEHCMNS